MSTWIMASRPKTLPAAAAPVVIGTAMAVDVGGFHLISCLAALVGALLIQIGTNFANDYYDFKKGADEGERLGPTRATQAGLVNPEAMRRAMVIVFALAILVGVYLVWRGGWPIVVIGLSSVLFGILYTGGPYPLGYNGLGELFVLIYFGPVAVGGTYYVQTLEINSIVLIAGLAPGLFSVAILAVNNLRDITNDRRAGKRTLAVRFGDTFARYEYTLAIVAAVLLPIGLWLRLGHNPYSMIALASLAAAVRPIMAVFTFTDGRKLNDVLAITGMMLLLYSLLFSVGWLL
ncbi:MAG: 1,4-dihydroxy-2-naphthoate polyprenyltransferase [candidate division Zixibacteria bacterium]|nr:1,4-dihydroxy-2-naphthoate polyprenyltransferase [candidate division Zixibacteria bacterium]